jgi:hypothetical protein
MRRSNTFKFEGRTVHIPPPEKPPPFNWKQPMPPKKTRWNRDIKPLTDKELDIGIGYYPPGAREFLALNYERRQAYSRTQQAMEENARKKEEEARLTAERQEQAFMNSNTAHLLAIYGLVSIISVALIILAAFIGVCWYLIPA